MDWAENRAEDTVVDGASLGRYVIEDRLGRGGMGSVFRARRIDLDEAVAVKVLRPELAEREELRARFLREAETVARLSHPHIVGVRETGLEDEVPYIVMELLEGESLADRLERSRPLPPATAVGWMLPVIAAVMHAHEQGVVHRDIKPRNIMLAEAGERIHPTVLDFGVAKCLSHPAAQELTESGIIFGTAHYMSPEQARGAKHVDARTDQYSIGVVLYYCVTGTLPFPGDNFLQVVNRITEGDYARPRAINPDVPEGLDAVVVKAMSGDRELRYPGLLELGRALLPFAEPAERAAWAPAFGPVADGEAGDFEPEDEETTATAPASPVRAESFDSLSDLRTTPRGTTDGVPATRPAGAAPPARRASTPVPMLLALGAALLLVTGLAAVGLAWWIGPADGEHGGDELHAEPTGSPSEEGDSTERPEPARDLEDDESTPRATAPDEGDADDGAEDHETTADPGRQPDPGEAEAKEASAAGTEPERETAEARARRRAAERKRARQQARQRAKARSGSTSSKQGDDTADDPFALPEL